MLTGTYACSLVLIRERLFSIKYNVIECSDRDNFLLRLYAYGVSVKLLPLEASNSWCYSGLFSESRCSLGGVDYSGFFSVVLVSSLPSILQSGRSTINHT